MGFPGNLPCIDDPLGPAQPALNALDPSPRRRGNIAPIEDFEGITPAIGFRGFNTDLKARE